MYQEIFTVLVIVGLVLVALSVKFLRKAIGLLIVILGGIACLTFIGAVFGIPMIIVGGILLFI